MPIFQFSDDEIEGWRDRRLKTCSRDTVLRALISSLLETARIEWRWVQSNHDVKTPSRPAHRKRVIQPGEIRGVLRALGCTIGPVRTASQDVFTRVPAEGV